jgi:hypothetical protein
MLAVLLCIHAVSALALEQVLINHAESPDDTRYDYPRRLLARVLEVTADAYGPFVLETNGLAMTRSRALESMVEGKLLHVMAEAPKPDWNERLLCVRIPIRKGIQGYRIFLTRNEHRDRLQAITSFDQFKALPTGSGTQWSTTRVLEEAGFNVVRGLDYEGLFGMLIRNRFVTFGRGINEVFVEYEQRQPIFKELAVDQRFLLYIPLPTYFFVSPTRPTLRDRIEKGMTALIESGEFETLFRSEFGPVIERAKLDQRILFSVPNPNLTKDDPLDVSHYWYRPEPIAPNPR